MASPSNAPFYARSASSSEGSSSRIDLTIPHSLLVLPPTAALVGLVIGMSRGGSRARLRFLAENAHRQPKTIQGWYFYTKTRNYRVFFAAAKTGSKYALGLGGATAAYCLLDESIGWTREHLFGLKSDAILDSKGKGRDMGDVVIGDDGESHAVLHDLGLARRVGWRDGPVKWEDGALAGMIMGGAVGFAYTLPRPLFFRSLLMGTLLGAATSALQILQAHIGVLREQQERERELRLPTALPLVEQVLTNPNALDDVDGGRLDVDRGLHKGDELYEGTQPVARIVDRDMPEITTGKEGKGGSWYSWIPGLGR